MNWAKLGGGLSCLLMTLGAAAAEDGDAASPAPIAFELVAQKEQQPEKKGAAEKKEDKTAPPQIDFSEAPPLTAEASSGPRPNMIGDPPPSLLTSLVLVPVPSLAKIRGDFANGQTIDVPFTGHRLVRVPVTGRSGFKIAENESPLPQDRVYFTYNYYNNVQGPSDGSDRALLRTQTITFRDQTVQADIFVPGVAPPRLDVHRETLGFEKSFLDGSFSLGMRVPIYQQNGAEPFTTSDLGDMTFIAKYSPYFNRQSGSGVSYGLAVTVPTGPSVQTPTGEIDSTILQPFVGYQMAMDRMLVYGFLSLAVPTESQDVTLLFNDIGIGYRLFDGNGGLISGIVPAVEAHVTTPMNHRETGAVIRGADLVILTGGVHFGLGRQSLLTLGAATSVTGPRTFDVEGIVQFNFRF